MLKLETSGKQCAGLEVTRHTWVPDVVSCQLSVPLSVALLLCQLLSAALIFHFQFADPTFWPIFCTHSDFQLLSTDYDSPLHYADFELKSIFLAIIVGTMFVTIEYMKVDQLK